MNLKLSLSDYLYNGSKKLKIEKSKTNIAQLYKDKEDYKLLSEQYAEEIDELQSKMYAHNKYGLLLIFQAMDGAGKDGTIKHVMHGVNAHGVKVFHINAHRLTNWNMIICGALILICLSAEV